MESLYYDWKLHYNQFNPNPNPTLAYIQLGSIWGQNIGHDHFFLVFLLPPNQCNHYNMTKSYITTNFTLTLTPAYNQLESILGQNISHDQFFPLFLLTPNQWNHFIMIENYITTYFTLTLTLTLAYNQLVSILGNII